jgi:hypothetical protein
MTTFKRMTEVIPAIVKDALPGMTVYSNEGWELEQYKNKYSLIAGKTVYVNLSQLNADMAYSDGETLLKAVYDIYINTTNDTIETVQKLQSSILKYSTCKVILNGVENTINIIDNGGSVINDIDKFINYNIEIYV